MKKTAILFFIASVFILQTANAQTTTLLSEGFEEGGTFPSTWQGGGAFTSAGSAYWMETKTDSIVNSNVSVYAGNYMAALWDQGFITITTNLITPPVNLTAYTSAQLKFHYIVCTYFGPVYYDSLYVNYYIGKHGTPHSLPISGYTQVTSNTPPPAWDSATITLPVGSDSVYVEFVGVYNQDNGIFLDNITITGVPRPTAVNNVNERNAFIAYPNPTSGVFELTRVNNSCKLIRVYNLLGQQIRDVTCNDGQDHVQIDLSNYPTGLYVYKAFDEGDNVIYQDKIIIQK